MSTGTYEYTALDEQGRKVRGAVEAGTDQEAYRKAAEGGRTPLAVRRARVRRGLFSFQKVTTRDVADLTRELSVLVEARIPLARGLAGIAEHEPKAELAAMLTDIATRIEAGAPLTDALGRYHEHFGEAYIETVRAAERSGNLVDVIGHLADLLEKSMETRQQFRRAMTYPIIVLAMVAAALTVIVVFVVPKFAATFAAQGVAMPVVTRVIQAIGESVKHHWYLYGGVMALAAGAGMVAWRSTAGNLWFESLFRRIPYLRSIVVAVTAGRFARVLGIGIGSGLGVIESLEVASRATARPLFVRECEKMAVRLRRGEAFSLVLRDSRYLPGFARRMIGAGKDSEELAKACGVVARHYDREASHLTKNINTIIEPLLTMGLAAIVLLVALAVFLPMWQMIKLRH